MSTGSPALPHTFFSTSFDDSLKFFFYLSFSLVLLRVVRWSIVHASHPSLLQCNALKTAVRAKHMRRQWRLFGPFLGHAALRARRQCHETMTSHVTGSSTPRNAAPLVVAELSTSRRMIAPTRDCLTSTPADLICPECGKRFLRKSILHQHRRTRHLVSLPTPEEEAQALAGEEIKALKEQLHAIRSRIKRLKNGKDESNAQKTAGNRSEPAASQGEDATPYPAAMVHGRILTNVSDEVLRSWETHRPHRVVGTSLSVWTGVGTVVPGSVVMGTLEGFQPKPDAPNPGPAPQKVLQFQLETLGHRERRPGHLKMFRNRVTVRHLFPADAERGQLFRVRDGDLLRVQGHYAQHKTFDAVSKSFVENPVVEADGIGLLAHGDAPEAGTRASPPTARVLPESSRPSAGAAKDDAEVHLAASVAVPEAQTPQRAISSPSSSKAPKKLKVKRRKGKRKSAGNMK